MTELVFEKLTQALGASEIWRLGIAASFVRVGACDYPVTVHLYRGGRRIGSMNGAQAGDYVEQVPFDAVWIENGATAQSVTIQLAGGGVGSDRINGEVSVIEGGVQRTKGGIAYWLSGKSAASAGLYSHVQLWNPAGSGRRLVVTEVAADRDTTGQVYIRSHSAALTSLGADTATGTGGKLIGATPQAGVGQLRNDWLAAVAGSVVSGISVTSATMIEKMSEPVVVMPGYGLMIVGADVNVGVRGNFQFWEEGI